MSDYSDENIEEIISVVGNLPEGDVSNEWSLEIGDGSIPELIPRKQALRHCLEVATQNWHIDSEFQTRSTPRQLANKYSKIEKAALKTAKQTSKLLEALSLPENCDPDNPIEPMPKQLRLGGLQVYAAREAESLDDATGEEVLREHIQAIYRLRDWAIELEARNRGRPPRNREERHTGDKAFNDLFSNLAEIWVEIFEKGLGTAVDPITGKAGGKFVQFYRASLAPIMGEDTPFEDAIRDRIRNLSSLKDQRRTKKT
ncbi:MAG: hypothetical protein HQ514_15900 [Rhodospirillales bacterium]|nr:hypothetical protein [Rhodospirillales bacterium]